MDEKKVVIKLGKDGSVSVEAFGFKSGSCEEATAFLDKIFKKETRKYKSSYYEPKDTLINGVGNGLCG